MFNSGNFLLHPDIEINISQRLLALDCKVWLNFPLGKGIRRLTPHCNFSFEILAAHKCTQKRVSHAPFVYAKSQWTYYNDN